MSLNKCLFIGNLGRDAELRYTQGGTAIASFSIACNEVWTDKNGQRQERVEWVRVALWGKQAEAVSQYLTKGKQVYVEGKLQSRKYEGRDHVEKTAVEIRADRVLLLGGRGGDGQSSQRGGGRPRGRQQQQHEEPEYGDDQYGNDGGGDYGTGDTASDGGFDDPGDDAPF